MGASKESHLDFGEDPRPEVVLRLAQVFRDCLDLVEERNPRYGDRWRNEPISFLWDNLWRKTGGLKHTYDESGVETMTREELNEWLKDVANYAAFVEMRMRYDEEDR